MHIQDWINGKYKEISSKLPTLVHDDPASFSCGFNVGYKQALLDLDCLIEGGAGLYKSMCKCGDKYHSPGSICL